MHIRAESIADHEGVRAVHSQAFGQQGEADLVDSLRAAGYAQVALVADIDGQIVGHVLFSDLPIQTENDVIPALALAPVAVLPDRQRRGVGSALIRAGLERCREDGHRIVIVLGEPAYYGRFGFRADLAQPLQSPFAGPAFQALELVPGALEGVAGEVRYPPPFFELGEPEA